MILWNLGGESVCTACRLAPFQGLRSGMTTISHSSAWWSAHMTCTTRGDGGKLSRWLCGFNRRILVLQSPEAVISKLEWKLYRIVGK
jgi:hypothetical protein